MTATKKPSTFNTELVDKFFPTTKTVGEKTFELKGFKEIAGHDDSLPYQAKLYIDGKEVGTAYNDGWGGETNIAAKEGTHKLIHETEKYLKEIKVPNCVIYGLQLYWDSLHIICDSLADNCSSRADIKKLTRKKMVIYNPKTKRLASVSFKGLNNATVQEAVENVPAFKTLWDKTTKKYEVQGYVILNNI